MQVLWVSQQISGRLCRGEWWWENEWLTVLDRTINSFEGEIIGVFYGDVEMNLTDWLMFPAVIKAAENVFYFLGIFDIQHSIFLLMQARGWLNWQTSVLFYYWFDCWRHSHVNKKTMTKYTSDKTCFIWYHPLK